MNINNTKFSTKPWSEVDKTELRNKLKEAGDEKAIYECFLYVEDMEATTSWCCPHHEIEGDTLVVNKNGVVAAWAALEGARGNKPDIPEKEYEDAMKHLAFHYNGLFKEGLIDSIPEPLRQYLGMADNIHPSYSVAEGAKNLDIEGDTSALDKIKENIKNLSGEELLILMQELETEFNNRMGQE